MRTMNRYVIPYAVCSLLVVGSLAHARDVQMIGQFGRDARVRVSADTGWISTVSGIAVQTPPESRDIKSAALWFLKNQRTLFGLDQSGLSLQKARVSSHLNQHIVHFGMAFDGLPIYFRQAVVQIDDSFHIRRVTTDVPLTGAHITQHPLPDETAAKRWAGDHAISPRTVVGTGWIATQNSGIRPVVKLDTRDENPKEPLELFVDAITGRVLHAEPIIWTADPLGAVFVENPITTPKVEIVPLPFVDPEAERLYGTYARVESCVDKENCKKTQSLAKVQEQGSFIYKPVVEEYAFDDPFAEVNAYYNITTMSSWAHDTLGWNGLFNEQTWITVKVGRAWYNAAYYEGNKKTEPYIAFGQDLVDFAYDADVAYHEFGHAINKSIWKHPWLKKTDLGSDISMFTIEEAFADIWAEHYADDPVMNNYVLLSRTADNSLTCPEDIMGEGHMDARILSGLGWDIRNEIGATAWGHIFYRSIHFLSSQAGFDDFADALVNSAKDIAEEDLLYGSEIHADIIQKKAIERGLYNQDCADRLSPMQEREHRFIYGYGRDRTGKYDFPFALQWKIEVPENTAAIKLFFEWRYPLENDNGDEIEPGFKVHIRRGHPVETNWIDDDDLEKGKPAFNAVASQTIANAPKSVDFPTIDRPPLNEGEEIYVLLSSATKEPVVVIKATMHFESTQVQPTPPKSDAPTDGTIRQVPIARNGTPDLSCRISHPGSAPSRPLFGVIKSIIRSFL